MDQYFEDVESYGTEVDSNEARPREALALDQPIRTLRLRAPLCIEGSRPVSEAIEIMRDNRNGSVLVTKSGKLVGIFTERDVLNKLALGEQDPTKVKLTDLMRPDPETLTPDAPMAYALNVMSMGGFRHIPLIDEEHRPVGVVSVRDIVNHIVDQFPDKVLNLPPRPGGDIPRSREGA